MNIKHRDERLLEIEDLGFFADSKDTPEHLNKALKRLEREDLIYEKTAISMILHPLDRKSLI